MIKIAKALPLGIRNNNPGNVKASHITWQGEILSTNNFENFSSPLMGLRCMMIVLLNFYEKYHLDTIQAIINRYAPPEENDTVAYQVHVAEQLQCNTLTHLKVYDLNILTTLARAIVLHEQGRPPFDSKWPENWFMDDLYQKAAQLAYSSVYAHHAPNSGV
jgi:hypothetical protein